ncbi:Lipid transfer-like protein VAS [Bienertia sinuspersici]
MENRMNHFIVLAFLVILATHNLLLSKAQGGSSCVNSLTPCWNYLNSTRDPPDSCCDPLKNVIESNQQCLCQMISTQGSFQAQLLGINISQVETLPERCGQRANPLACLKGVSGSKNSVPSATIRSFPSLMMIFLGALLLITTLY